MLVDLSINTGIQRKKSGLTNVTQDESLVQKIARGDEPALHELYAAYGRRMYAYALRLTSDPAKAEDVVQDSLIVVWKTAKMYRGEGRVITWLLGIVHHLAIKSLRHQNFSITEEMESTLVAVDPSPEETVETQQSKQLIRQSLNSLSVDHRAVLELIFYQGLSLEEVSRVCQIPLGTVKSRLSYARQSLKGVLSREGVEA